MDEQGVLGIQGVSLVEVWCDARAHGHTSLSSSLCKWLPAYDYMGNRPIKRIAS
jgi:hypothetical protein